MRNAIIVVIAALLAGAPLRAQISPADPLLDHLIGHWVLRGPMAGKSVVHDVTFRWVLNSEYVKMHEVSRELTGTGKPAYEAIVYMGRDPHTHEYSALWLDNTAYGAFKPAGVGRGIAAADSIPFIFIYSPTSRFHTTFVYNRTSDTWAWHMDDDDAGTLSPFARVTLTRSDPQKR